jgi:hypothetical protein
MLTAIRQTVHENLKPKEAHDLFQTLKREESKKTA